MGGDLGHRSPDVFSAELGVDGVEVVSTRPDVVH